jgi:small subunit ribosomal protein S17
MAKKTETKKPAVKAEKATEAKEMKEAKAPAHSTAPKTEKSKAVTKAPLADEDKVMKHLKLHGKEFVGTVISDKANKTVTVEWERRRLIKKFERYERRYSRVSAPHPTAINAHHGDTVRIKETRPLSKTKNFVVVEVMKRADEGSQ